ncbi:hypothetical protein PT974_09296 [Cladobotryum mycophilum]|uniref:Uncharacterized protein n=1 Tax=Cladobotryum mycophilum TaxID=491253 RepID=A0ABR0SGX0_9HYPO
MEENGFHWDWWMGLKVAGALIFAKTSPLTSSTVPLPPAASLAQDGDLESGSLSPPSPTLSTTSTADAPKLPERASAILRAPPSDLGDDNVGSDDQFGTASWGSPYPRSDANLRRQSFSSEGSDDFQVHQLDIATPFLRPPPVFRQRQQPQPEPQPEPQSTVSAAAAVLANRVRRQPRGLTEGWIRNHTAAAENTEPRHWLSEGSSSENSLSGSESGWFHDQDHRTPKPLRKPHPSLGHRRHHHHDCDLDLGWRLCNIVPSRVLIP